MEAKSRSQRIQLQPTIIIINHHTSAAPLLGCANVFFITRSFAPTQETGHTKTPLKNITLFERSLLY